MLDLNARSHSYDDLEIINIDNRYCVRKTFRSDLGRAHRNVSKQSGFSDLYTGSLIVSAADVIEFNIYDDTAELIMPYIDGINGPMFPIQASRSIGQNLSSALSTVIFFNMSRSSDQAIRTALFDEKIQTVHEATTDAELRHELNSCRMYIARLPAELTFPIGPCHGDLTLSNVILNPATGITLIDFLDTYLETPLQDAAKLKQDYIYGWSFRKETASIRIKAEIFCRYHYPYALKQVERMYPVQMNLLTLMTLARICPYVTDSLTHRWLLDSLSKCMGELQS